VIRVVIADDHNLVRAGLAQLLADADDIDVVGMAGDGHEAVTLATEHEADVVLMDLSMPELDGIEATRAIGDKSPDSRVVVLTSFSDRARILDALDAGAIGYLLKDVRSDELARAIHAAARGQAPLDPRAAREVLVERRRPGPELSAREEEVLSLVARGLPNKLIARHLGISERTVKGHLTRIFERVGVADRTQAALWAREHGLG